MTQLPPPHSSPINYGRPDAPPQANSLAIVSLVCGIIGCLVVTPFVAIITGLLALGRARLQGGRGLAITGIILGTLWIVGGLGVGGVAYYAVTTGIKMAKTATAETVNALVDGDISKARPYTTMSDAELNALSAKVQSYGRCTDVSVDGFNSRKNAGSPSLLVINGKATFEKAGVKNYSTVVTNKNNGVMVEDLKVE